MVGKYLLKLIKQKNKKYWFILINSCYIFLNKHFIKNVDSITVKRNQIIFRCSITGKFLIIINKDKINKIKEYINIFRKACCIDDLVIQPKVINYSKNLKFSYNFSKKFFLDLYFFWFLYFFSLLFKYFIFAVFIKWIDFFYSARIFFKIKLLYFDKINILDYRNNLNFIEPFCFFSFMLPFMKNKLKFLSSLNTLLTYNIEIEVDNNLIMYLMDNESSISISRFIFTRGWSNNKFFFDPFFIIKYSGYNFLDWFLHWKCRNVILFNQFISMPTLYDSVKQVDSLFFKKNMSYVPSCSTVPLIYVQPYKLFNKEVIKTNILINSLPLSAYKLITLSMLNSFLQFINKQSSLFKYNNVLSIFKQFKIIFNYWDLLLSIKQKYNTSIFIKMCIFQQLKAFNPKILVNAKILFKYKLYKYFAKAFLDMGTGGVLLDKIIKVNKEIYYKNNNWLTIYHKVLWEYGFSNYNNEFKNIPIISDKIFIKLMKRFNK